MSNQQHDRKPSITGPFLYGLPDSSDSLHRRSPDIGIQVEDYSNALPSGAESERPSTGSSASLHTPQDAPYGGSLWGPPRLSIPGHSLDIPRHQSHSAPTSPMAPAGGNISFKNSLGADFSDPFKTLGSQNAASTVVSIGRPRSRSHGQVDRSTSTFDIEGAFALSGNGSYSPSFPPHSPSLIPDTFGHVPAYPLTALPYSPALSSGSLSLSQPQDHGWRSADASPYSASSEISPGNPDIADYQGEYFLADPNSSPPLPSPSSQYPNDLDDLGLSVSLSFDNAGPTSQGSSPFLQAGEDTSTWITSLGLSIEGESSFGSINMAVPSSESLAMDGYGHSTSMSEMETGDYGYFGEGVTDPHIGRDFNTSFANNTHHGPYGDNLPLSIDPSRLDTALSARDGHHSEIPQGDLPNFFNPPTHPQPLSQPPLRRAHSEDEIIRLKQRVYDLLIVSKDMDELSMHVESLVQRSHNRIYHTFVTNAVEHHPKESEVGKATAQKRRVRDPTFRCILCQDLMTTNNNLQNHYRSHLEMPIYKCTFCGKRFMTDSIRKRHMRTTNKCPGSAKFGARKAASDVLEGSSASGL